MKEQEQHGDLIVNNIREGEIWSEKIRKGDVACWEIAFFLYESKLPNLYLSLFIGQEAKIHHSLSNELQK